MHVGTLTAARRVGRLEKEITVERSTWRLPWRINEATRVFSADAIGPAVRVAAYRSRRSPFCWVHRDAKRLTIGGLLVTRFRSRMDAHQRKHDGGHEHRRYDLHRIASLSLGPHAAV